MEQQQIFNGTVYGVSITQMAKSAQPRNVHRTAVVTEENDTWCGAVADAISDATGNMKYGKSTVINEAISFYRTFYKHRHQLLAKRKMISALIENM